MNLPEGTKVSISLRGISAEGLRRYNQSDPNFERAIAALAEAEVNEEDPLEGKAIDFAEDPAALAELRKVLRGG